jgi:tetratricopeptide (TPR) repeat protein
MILAGAGTMGLAQRIRGKAWSAVAAAFGFLALAYPAVYWEITPPDFARVRWNMAAAHEMRARNHVARAEALFDSGADADAELERSEELYGLAEAEIRRALESDARRPRLQRALRKLLVDRTRAHFESGRFEAALERALVLTTTYPNYADAHALLGAIHARLGNRREAAESLGRALTLAPDHPRASQELQRLLHSESTPRSPERE